MPYGRNPSITSALTHQMSEFPHPGSVESCNSWLIDIEVKGILVSP